MTVVTDLKANKLFNSLKILISNLTSSDNAFATEVSQMYRSTQIKTNCTDKALLEFMGLLEIEMSNRAREDDEDRRRRAQANMAASSSNSPPEAANAAAAAGKGGRKGKGKPKDGGKGEKRTVCQEYLTDKGCPKGDQCPHAHPERPPGSALDVDHVVPLVMTWHHVEGLQEIQRQKGHLLHPKDKEKEEARQKPSLNQRLRHRHMKALLHQQVQMQHGLLKKRLDLGVIMMN